MPPKRIKKVRLGIYRTQIQPKLAQDPVIFFIVVTVIKSVRRPIAWPARRIMRVNKRRQK